MQYLKINSILKQFDLSGFEPKEEKDEPDITTPTETE